MSGVFGTTTLKEFISTVTWLEGGQQWVDPIVAFFEKNGLKVWRQCALSARLLVLACMLCHVQGLEQLKYVDDVSSLTFPEDFVFGQKAFVKVDECIVHCDRLCFRGMGVFVSGGAEDLRNQVPCGGRRRRTSTASCF